MPDERTLAALVVLFLLVGSFSFVQTPVKTQQLAVTPAEYQAAQWMKADAENRDLSQADSRVFSRMDRNRMYNYFVTGRKSGYGFALNFYTDFILSNDGQTWYSRVEDNTGYIVIGRYPTTQEFPPETLYTRLYRHYGSHSDVASGLSHYRAVYTSDDGTVTVFVPVPGATIVGTAPSNETLTLSTRVEIPGAMVTYERVVSPDSDGNYSVTVPYPGTYTVGEQTVSVSEHDVENGTNVTLS